MLVPTSVGKASQAEAGAVGGGTMIDFEQRRLQWHRGQKNREADPGWPRSRLTAELVLPAPAG